MFMVTNNENWILKKSIIKTSLETENLLEKIPEIIRNQMNIDKEWIENEIRTMEISTVHETERDYYLMLNYLRARIQGTKIYEKGDENVR